MVFKRNQEIEKMWANQGLTLETLMLQLNVIDSNQ